LGVVALKVIEEEEKSCRIIASAESTSLHQKSHGGLKQFRFCEPQQIYKRLWLSIDWVKWRGWSELKVRTMRFFDGEEFVARKLTD
jgi:hypothetical protein